MGKASIKYCPKCSNVKKKIVSEALGKGVAKTGCIGCCAKKHPELADKAFARIDGELVVCDSAKKLVKKMAKAVA